MSSLAWNLPLRAAVLWGIEKKLTGVNEMNMGVDDHFVIDYHGRMRLSMIFFGMGCADLPFSNHNEKSDKSLSG